LPPPYEARLRDAPLRRVLAALLREARDAAALWDRRDLEAPVLRDAVADRRLEEASSSSAWLPASSPASLPALEDRLELAASSRTLVATVPPTAMDPDLRLAGRETDDLEGALDPDRADAASSAWEPPPDFTDLLTGRETPVSFPLSDPSSPPFVAVARVPLRRLDLWDGARLPDFRLAPSSSPARVLWARDPLRTERLDRGALELRTLLAL